MKGDSSREFTDVVIVDYGLGNLGSIANMLKHIGVSSLITSNRSDILGAKRLVLAGVGSFDHGMSMLKEMDLIGVIKDAACRTEVSLLGVCLGMQLLFDGSEEGTASGLSLLAGFSKKFPNLKNSTPVTVPHMGWNKLTQKNHTQKLLNSYDNERFYFVHSYYVDPLDATDVIYTANHGIDFSAIVSRGNVTGVQFHPEKSHRQGMAFLTDFVKSGE
jgi:glutamine amidotransferase